MRNRNWRIDCKPDAMPVLVDADTGERVTFLDRESAAFFPLIAAAPAMLAALKVARAEIHNPGAFASCTDADIAEYMDTVIRNAEGR